MKEAYGGIVNIVFITLFLIIVMGLLGFTVSYTKAFKMKNAIIKTIEEYEGSGCYPESPLSPAGTSTQSECRNSIKEKAKRFAFNPPQLKCHGENEYMSSDGLYCYSIEKISKDRMIITVITQADMSFPILEEIMGFRFLQVKGETKVLHIQS